jgi:hypothetical protein
MSYHFSCIQKLKYRLRRLVDLLGGRDRRRGTGGRGGRERQGERKGELRVLEHWRVEKLFAFFMKSSVAFTLRMPLHKIFCLLSISAWSALSFLIPCK